MIREKVVTAGLKRPKQSETEFQSMMTELRRLVDTAGGVVLEEFSQTRPNPDPATYYGPGKIEEIAAHLKVLGIKTIVFDDDLSPAQQKNVEKALKAKVVDRTRLILDIFAQRARSKEGQLQVELAQLSYLVPRLTGAWRGYSQQMGGIGVRGPGERKIEVERRYVRDRIKAMKKEIEQIRDHRERARQGRKLVPIPQIALVGYTNAGKSTLLNTLVGESAVYADDKLFATLDPTTRRVKLPDGRAVLFTDTVGFIQKLPEGLRAAFQATLEESAHATLMVHVVDATADNRDEQIAAVEDSLKLLNTDKIPVMMAYNKVDLLKRYEQESLRKKGGILISAKKETGLKELLRAIEEKLDQNMVEKSFILPHAKQHLLNGLYKIGHILEKTFTEEGTHLKVRMDNGNWQKLFHQLALKS